MKHDMMMLVLVPPTQCIRDDEESVEGCPHYEPFGHASNNHRG